VGHLARLGRRNRSDREDRPDIVRHVGERLVRRSVGEEAVLDALVHVAVVPPQDGVLVLEPGEDDLLAAGCLRRLDAEIAFDRAEPRDEIGHPGRCRGLLRRQGTDPDGQHGENDGRASAPRDHEHLLEYGWRAKISVYHYEGRDPRFPASSRFPAALASVAVPELPEVETIVRRLRGALTGRTVVRARVLRDNVVRGSPRQFVRAVEGSRIASVDRRAKFILLGLEDGRVWVSHLRMSGKWLVEPPRAVRESASEDLPGYTRATFDLDDGVRLLYVDPRTLGEMEVLPAAAWRAREAKLGPEPLEPAFTPDLLAARLATSGRPVKEALLDQTRVAGLGNIYVSEALWRAGISPRRRARNVGPVRARRLHAAILAVLSEAIGRSGTSFGSSYLDFVDVDGEAGDYYDFLAVYDREGEPCPRCGAPVARIVQGQRSTFYCSRCQR
jgi:formamidopyrimidine-DNA glycosylase